MSNITLTQADLIADAALQKGRTSHFQPLTVVVLDAGGHTKVIKREDGSSLMRADIAMGKAWGVLGMGFGGRELARRVAQISPAPVRSLGVPPQNQVHSFVL